jgi:PEP-CTERM motif-containing protein
MIQRRASVRIIVALAVLCFPLVTQGGTINIILSDMDVSYSGTESGGTLFDFMGGLAGGNLSEATADNISTAVFEVDDAVQGVLVNGAGNGDDIHGDLRISNLGPSITKDVFHPVLGNNGGGFGFDFFTDSGFQVRLGINQISLFVSNTAFFFTGTATLLSQNLPFGIVPFDSSKPVQFSYTATLPAVNGILSSISMGGASGALTISGIQIPEPGTIGLLMAGVAVLTIGVLCRRRRNTTFS